MDHRYTQDIGENMAPDLKSSVLLWDCDYPDVQEVTSNHIVTMKSTNMASWVRDLPRVPDVTISFCTGGKVGCTVPLAPRPSVLICQMRSKG